MKGKPELVKRLEELEIGTEVAVRPEEWGVANLGRLQQTVHSRSRGYIPAGVRMRTRGADGVLYVWFEKDAVERAVVGGMRLIEDLAAAGLKWRVVGERGVMGLFLEREWAEEFMRGRGLSSEEKMPASPEAVAKWKEEIRAAEARTGIKEVAGSGAGRVVEVGARCAYCGMGVKMEEIGERLVFVRHEAHGRVCPGAGKTYDEAANECAELNRDSEEKMPQPASEEKMPWE